MKRFRQLIAPSTFVMRLMLYAIVARLISTFPPGQPAHQQKKLMDAASPKAVTDITGEVS